MALSVFEQAQVDKKRAARRQADEWNTAHPLSQNHKEWVTAYHEELGEVLIITVAAEMNGQAIIGIRDCFDADTVCNLESISFDFHK